MRFLGIDLARGEGSSAKPANRSGVVALDEHGRMLDAAWTIGLADTAAWIDAHGAPPVLAFVDAPLVVTNPAGQRECETHVGKRFGRHWVSANTTNLASPRQAGVHLRERLVAAGWRYDDGLAGPPTGGRVVSECYPYTTLVGARQFAFRPRPAYKRKPRHMTMAQFWPERLKAWDEIVERLERLSTGDPPLDLTSHPATDALRTTPAAGKAQAYKTAEDLLDAVICAWTAALWHRHPEDCAVLGPASRPPDGRPVATIIAPVSADA
jgi:predicted RNase H-like nuclease